MTEEEKNITICALNYKNINTDAWAKDPVSLL
jgi:hypothetical protein